MRNDISGGITAQLPVSGAWFGYLLEITTNDSSLTLRYCNFGITFSFDSQSWLPLDFTLPDISWDGAILRTGKLIIADTKLKFWVMALDGLLTDARMRIWAAYGDVPDEAAAIWTGRIGQMARNGLTVEIGLTTGSDTESSPRTRIQAVVDPAFLIPGGTILVTGTQQWTLNRSTSAAG